MVFYAFEGVLSLVSNVKSPNRLFSALVEKEDDWFVATCPELEIASQGKSVEDALSNLREAVFLYVEDEDVQKALARKKFTSPLVTMISV